MGILQALFGGGNQGQQSMNALQGQDPNAATGMPQSQGIVPNILSQRFQPSMDDIGQAALQSGLNHSYVSPSAISKQNLSLQQQMLENQAAQMKNQMTAFKMPLMQRQMQALSGGMVGQPNLDAPQQNGQSGNIPQTMQQNAQTQSQPQGTPYDQDSRITMSKLAASIGNKPLSEAYMQDYQNDPNTIARAKGIEANATGEQARLNESQKTALGIQKDINDDADTAIKTKRILGEMGTLSQSMTPGKYAGFNKAVAEWKIANGIGTDADQALATSSQGIDKLTAQLATQAMTEFTKRGTQMEFKTFLQNNPNIGMTPGGFQTLLSYMDKTSDIPLKKQQDFIQWKAPNGKQRPLSEYPDFDGQWNQQFQQNIGSTLQAPITASSYNAPQRISLKDMK